LRLDNVRGCFQTRCGDDVPVGRGCTEMTVVEFRATAGLVFATFCMKTMIPLRLVGITSNVTFLMYAWLAGLVPLLVLHSALLPLNIWRLTQIRALVREVRKVAVGDLPLESLLPFMSPRRAKAGEVLFRRGDAAGEMFHLLSGAVRLDELGKTLGPGAMLGEISMFAPRRERTATAVCDTDVELLSITAEKVMQLYYQNPRFGVPRHPADHRAADREPAPRRSGLRIGCRPRPRPGAAGGRASHGRGAPGAPAHGGAPRAPPAPPADLPSTVVPRRRSPCSQPAGSWRLTCAPR
jgi:CRP/FNR family transcriptional regulator, cyclic AMP receptor protein